MPLKSTGNTVAIFGAMLAVFACMAKAYAETGCPKETGFIIYSGLKLENSTICISSNDEFARLTITKKHPDLTIENKSLIEISDINDGIVHLEKDGNKASLYFEYPNNVYLITIDADSGKLAGANQSIKIAALDDKSVRSTLTLKTKENYIATAHVESMTKDSLFGKEKMEIFANTKLKITAPKTYLWNSPDDASPTKMYLIMGDKIEAREYRNGKLKITYTTKKGQRIEKWIDISSIL